MQIFRRNCFFFSGALITGMMFGFLWRKYEEFQLRLPLYMPMPKPNNFEHLYNIWLQKEGFERVYHTPAKGIKENKYLREHIRILCVVITTKVKQAKAIKNTWIKHCNRAVFYGSYENEGVPVGRLPNTKPWPLLCGGLLRAWKHYHNDFDWMLVVDDYTFAIVENLRYLVAPLSSLKIYYLGHPVKDYTSGNHYNSKKAGYVISHQLMNIFAHTLPDDDACDNFFYPYSSEDCILGKLLNQMGAITLDTRDNLGRGRFNSFDVQILLIPNSISMSNPYWKDSVYISHQGDKCCSDFAVTFHKMTPSKMYLLEYAVYRLKVFHDHRRHKKSKTQKKTHSTSMTKLISNITISDRDYIE